MHKAKSKKKLLLVPCLLVVILLVVLKDIKYIKYDITQSYVEDERGNKVYAKDYFMIDGFADYIGIIHPDGSTGYINTQGLMSVEVLDLSCPVKDSYFCKYYSSEKGGWYYSDKESIFFDDINKGEEYELYKAEDIISHAYTWKCIIKYFRLNGNLLYMKKRIAF
ncbi:hypothetical protein LJC58_02595 [Lachnospiraceae bacterium OttesenSCG-928-D06]|nr:hypothetical protein [Lachnospiraceae bacterium OttesenSCG-928-D06]